MKQRTWHGNDHPNNQQMTCNCGSHLQRQCDHHSHQERREGMGEGMKMRKGKKQEQYDQVLIFSDLVNSLEMRILQLEVEDQKVSKVHNEVSVEMEDEKDSFEDNSQIH